METWMDSGSHVEQQNYRVSLRQDLPAISFCTRKIGHNGNLQDVLANNAAPDGVSMATGIYVAHARGSMRAGICPPTELSGAHYQSATTSALSASIPPVAGHTMLDTRLSFALPHWVVTAYVDNLADNIGITAYQDPAVFGNRYMAIVSQPRTIGLRI